MHVVAQSLRPSLRYALARRSSSNRHVISIVWSRCCSSHGTSKPIPNPAPSATTPPHDHQALGKRLNLFSTTPYSAGSPLLHADGSHIFLKLQSLLRAQHQAFGFKEVISPVIYKQSLWEKSGHWQNYSDDMFEVVGHGARGETEGKEPGEDEKWGLKPMNCPGHCLLFATETRSYRDLPVRFADFSPLHRNEISGALTGLTRVRRFHQDDGHIFCRPDQVKSEIASTLRMVNLIYSAFNLTPHKLLLSTRPETSFIGTASEWDRAESQLASALDESGLPWSLNPGDGAFYGPKIDIILRDRNEKDHQTATIQLDFQLPQRFELEYQPPTSSNEVETPILIHRAVLGSLERFMALLIEHYAGRWPFWLNPRQIAILPLNDDSTVLAWAEEVSHALSGAGQLNRESLQALSTTNYTVDIDSAGESTGKKIFRAREKGYEIACVIGKREVAEKTVAVSFLHAGSGERSERMRRIEKILKGHGILEGRNESDWQKQARVTVDVKMLKAVLGEIERQWL